VENGARKNWAPLMGSKMKMNSLSSSSRVFIHTLVRLKSANAIIFYHIIAFLVFMLVFVCSYFEAKRPILFFATYKS
jgi:hypothetical protein